MPSREMRYRSWVKVLVPTKSQHNKTLPKAEWEPWVRRTEQLFRKHVNGYQVSPHYTYKIKGNYLTDSGQWITEPNWVVSAYGTAKTIRTLVKAVKEGLLVEMGRALDQESVAVESSTFGLEVLYLDDNDHETNVVEGCSEAE